MEGKRKQGRLPTAPAEPSMGSPSVEALAMAGRQCMPQGACCSHEVDDGMPPEHLRSFEAYLEKVVPVDMFMASRRVEDARLQRGGKARSHDDDMKEKLKLWAKAVVKKTMERR
jgi:hypothetical protein